MIKELIVADVIEDDVYGYSHSQTIYDISDDILFSVQNLNQCPEDAVIGRDLFSASDYVDALNKGIELAAKGYTKVISKYVSKDIV